MATHAKGKKATHPCKCGNPTDPKLLHDRYLVCRPFKNCRKHFLPLPCDKCEKEGSQE